MFASWGFNLAEILYLVLHLSITRFLVERGDLYGWQRIFDEGSVYLGYPHEARYVDAKTLKCLEIW